MCSFECKQLLHSQHDFLPSLDTRGSLRVRQLSLLHQQTSGLDRCLIDPVQDFGGIMLLLNNSSCLQKPRWVNFTQFCILEMFIRRPSSDRLCYQDLFEGNSVTPFKNSLGKKRTVQKVWIPQTLGDIAGLQKTDKKESHEMQMVCHFWQIIREKGWQVPPSFISEATLMSQVRGGGVRMLKGCGTLSL